MIKGWLNKRRTVRAYAKRQRRTEFPALHNHVSADGISTWNGWEYVPQPEKTAEAERIATKANVDAAKTAAAFAEFAKAQQARLTSETKRLAELGNAIDPYASNEPLGAVEVEELDLGEGFQGPKHRTLAQVKAERPVGGCTAENAADTDCECSETTTKTKESE